MTNSKTTVEKAEVSKRVTRALSGCFYAEKGQYGEDTYRVFSGSGSIYAVDLDGPDGERYCACPDTGWCEHILYVLIIETPTTFLECEHGDPHCPGSAAISVVDGEPEYEGRLPCLECFNEAFVGTDPIGTTDTSPVRADGGQPMTTLEADQIFTDDDGGHWTIDKRVEQVPTPTGTQPRVRLVDQNGNIRRIAPRTFVKAVEDEQGEFSLATDDSNGGGA